MVSEIFDQIRRDVEEGFPGKRLPNPADLSPEALMNVAQSCVNCVSCTDRNGLDDCGTSNIAQDIQDILID